MLTCFCFFHSPLSSHNAQCLPEQPWQGLPMMIQHRKTKQHELCFADWVFMVGEKGVCVDCCVAVMPRSCLPQNPRPMDRIPFLIVCPQKCVCWCLDSLCLYVQLFVARLLHHTCAPLLQPALPKVVKELRGPVIGGRGLPVPAEPPFHLLAMCGL